MKRFFLLSLLVIALLACSLFLLVSCDEGSEGAGNKMLYIYNWGEYIADGSEGSIDLIEEFERLTGYTVVYETFDSNESMYAMLESGAAVYDIVIPSDYMIQRLIREDMLQKINYANIPNAGNVDPKYKGLYYDPTDEYSIPYNVGMVAVVYNTTLVDEEDAARQSIDLLWNPKYRGNILTFDNARDGFAMAQVKMRMSFNSPYKEDWDRAFDALAEQKKVLQGYTMDGIFSKMEGENAAVGVYYAGDCLSMIDENPDLSLYYPKEGTNLFVDAMCIPKNAQNVAAAEAFINFILEEEYAVENALYLYYASPNKKVQENEYYKEEMGYYDEETGEYDPEGNYALLYEYPEQYLTEDGKLNDTVAQYYHNLGEVPLKNKKEEDLGDSVLNYMTELWIRLKLV